MLPIPRSLQLTYNPDERTVTVQAGAGLRLAVASRIDPLLRLHRYRLADELTGYLVQEVLNGQPPEVRELLLSTSILDHVSAEASKLAGTEQADRILQAVACANAFVQPPWRGQYGYHTARYSRWSLRGTKFSYTGRSYWMGPPTKPWRSS